MRHLLSALLALGLTSCVVRSSLYQQPDRRILDLQREKDRVKHLEDPVDRTKSDIRISEILLSLTGDAIRKGDLESAEQRLNDYVAAIQDAHQTMSKTGRDAHRKPKGFKDLEISLRRQINQLKDIGGTLTFDQRDHVEKARTEASRIRDELLKALFGNSNGTSNS